MKAGASYWLSDWVGVTCTERVTPVQGMPAIHQFGCTFVTPVGRASRSLSVANPAENKPPIIAHGRLRRQTGGIEPLTAHLLSEADSLMWTWI